MEREHDDKANDAGSERTVTMRQRAYEEIKRRIVDGTWPGGTFLAEKMLGDLLGMSKTPIRSALDRLEMAGLVKLSPKQGVIVQEVSLKKILDIYELRLSLETFAARAIAGKLDAAYLAKLDENLRQQEQALAADDLNAYVRLDKLFHELIVGGLDNEEFTEAMVRIQDKFAIVLRATFVRNKGRLRGSWIEHKRIRDALAGSDPDLAERLVAEHIQYVKAVML